MSLWCKVFGHAMPPQGWWGDGLYGEVRGGREDGVGRTHFEIWHSCPRCGESWMAARFHGTDPALRPTISRAVKQSGAGQTLDVTGWEVVDIGGGWRHVSHDQRLATSSWLTAEAAKRNAGGYRGDPVTLAILARRYASLYGEGARSALARATKQSGEDE